MADRCFINSIAQVSCQKPLCDEWFDTPETFSGDFIRAQEPVAKDVIPAAEARRMGRILKRAICTSLHALKESKIQIPDAIVTGTAMGCMENSEKFLIDLSNLGENCLKPTLFMQSTHNTISSLIAIFLKCHGYNNTYSHKGISFESALLDAWLLIRQGAINNALVGAHDEVTPIMSRVLKTTHPEYSFISETSVSAVLSSEASADNLCEVERVELFNNPSVEDLADSINGDSPQVLVVGMNGIELNDHHYLNLIEHLKPTPIIAVYKNIFGDNFSSSALGFYSGVMILKKQYLPDFMLRNNIGKPDSEIKSLAILNHSEAKNWGLIRLKKF